MLEEIRVCIKENIVTDIPEYNGSSVALKYRIGDQLYGQVIRVDKTSLSAQDVVNIANVLLCQALQLYKEVTNGKKE